jgi:hypothetical protein
MEAAAMHRRSFVLATAACAMTGAVTRAAHAQHAATHDTLPGVPSSAEPYARLQGGVPHHMTPEQESQRFTDSPAPAGPQGRWTPRAALPIPRSEMAWATAAQGRMHVVGGYGEGKVNRDYHHIYDPQADRWLDGAPLPRGANHVAVTAEGGRVYALGGFVEQNRRSDTHAYVYDIAANRWSAIAPLPRPRGAAAAVMLDGALHLIGGASEPAAERASVGWHEVYDPKADRWTSAKPLPGARDHVGCVAHGDRIHVVGGRFNTFEYNTDLHHVYLPARYAQRAYLEYALSVVKGRALPDVCDGQKPVQRRILYSMSRMGLGFGTGGGAKPVKSARVVGDVLGRFHPHGDQAAYDALVRMAQDFAQRYPLIDGQGNFGSRDGDGAAAMRYTEARLARITNLLLEEIDEGTVDFIPNYDGSTQEPVQLPARLPFALLNGASGIAVGLATEIPSHNLREIADACVALVKNPKLTDEELFALVPGPDYPGGGQIISSATDIADAYRTGRGSLKVRARWKIEELARGQWQLVVNELPPGVSSQRVLEEIEELTNPKVKAGKKALLQDQLQLKQAVLSVLDAVRDESSKDAAVRLVFEPKTSRIEQSELITTLLAHTSLETSVPINLTMVGLDGRPVQKSLRQMLSSGSSSASAPSSAARATAWPRCWTASTSSRAGSWCC